MADITATLVKELRERTGSGIMECKKALVKAQGNIEKAIDDMRKFGQAKAAKKACRIAAEGIILTKISQDGKYGVIIELNSETDFIAKDSSFRAFGDEVITIALKDRISDVEMLKSKFEEQRIALVAKVGENINIRRLGVLEGDVLCSYMHGVYIAYIGVIVSISGADEKLAKQIAMHIAASKPEYINADDVPVDILSREHKIQLDIAMNSGKSYEIAEKIAEGRMRKFISEISLTGQHFILDPSKTVSQLLDEYSAKINSFIRFEVGEGAKLNYTNEVAIGKSF